MVRMIQIKRQQGQVALIVLLIMAAGLALGLATSKKVVVDTKINKDQELLKQAFNAAESGINTYIGSGNQGTNLYHSSDNSSSANVAVTTIGGNTPTVSYPGYILSNRIGVVWLVNHNLDATRSIDWNTYYRGANVVMCASATTGALKLAYYAKTATTVAVQRWVYNLSGTSLVTNGLPIVPASGIDPCPSPMHQIAEVPIAAGTIPIALVAVPLNTSSMLGAANPLVSDGGVFPIQGELVTSTGIAGNISAQAGASRTITQEFRWDGGLLNYLLEGVQANSDISTQ